MMDGMPPPAIIEITEKTFTGGRSEYDQANDSLWNVADYGDLWL